MDNNEKTNTEQKSGLSGNVSALALFVTALTGFIVALHEAGIIGKEPTPSTTPTSSSTISRPTTTSSQQASSIPASTSISTVQATSTPTSQAALSQGQAVDLVEAWLRAKREIFAEPFDRELLRRLAHTNGPLHRDITARGKGINWLQSANSYYTYRVSTITDEWSFSSSLPRPKLKVRIYEDRTLHTPHGTDSRYSGSSTFNATYTFEQEGGSWKIYDVEEEK